MDRIDNVKNAKDIKTGLTNAQIEKNLKVYVGQIDGTDEAVQTMQDRIKEIIGDAQSGDIVEIGGQNYIVGSLAYHEEEGTDMIHLSIEFDKVEH